MNLAQAISSLSKSSAAAVRTLDSSHEVEALKEYLYIETEIEQVFVDWMKASRSTPAILFLCGSSGDGKSEILRKYHKKYSEDFLFHLDGTHSYHPEKGAIDTLNEQFSEYKKLGKSLVVGINIGMLGNYAEEGAEEHRDVKQAIKDYLSTREAVEGYEFISFDDFPKYQAKDGSVQGQFIVELLEKVTLQDEVNPFYKAYLEAKGMRGRKGASVINFEFLSLPCVRKVLIATILQARLKFQLFLTARTLLDAIHHLLSDKGYLFDNLFSSHGSELMNSLALLDPNRERKRDVDMFLIQRALKIEDLEFIDFQDQIVERFGVRINHSASWLRLCYILQTENGPNGFQKRISASFNQKNMEEYIDQWILHSIYSGDRAERKGLRDYYLKTFLHALRRYANRRSPNLGNSYFFLKEVNGYIFASKVKIDVNFKAIEEDKPRNLGAFSLHLSVEGEALRSVTVDAGLFDLVDRINHGYRPNKYDKSSIVILEELIEEIQSRGSALPEMIIEKAGATSVVVFDEENDEITLEENV